MEWNRKGKWKRNLCVSSFSSLLVLAVNKYILKCFCTFSYRLPLNTNNYTEKGQRKSLGNGRCTDEKGPAAGRYTIRSPNFLLLSSKRPNSLLSPIVFYNKPSKDLDVKNCDRYMTFLPSQCTLTGKTDRIPRPAVTRLWSICLLF